MRRDDELTPESFDRLTVGSKPPKIIWTLQAIGQKIGVGPDFVRDTIATAEGSPVHEIGGRFYAFEDDLLTFLRRGPMKPSQTV